MYNCFAITDFTLQNPLLDGGDLSTIIAYGSSNAHFDEHGRPIYKNRKGVRLYLYFAGIDACVVSECSQISLV